MTAGFKVGKHLKQPFPVFQAIVFNFSPIDSQCAGTIGPHGTICKINIGLTLIFRMNDYVKQAPIAGPKYKRYITNWSDLSIFGVQQGYTPMNFPFPLSVKIARPSGSRTDVGLALGRQETPATRTRRTRQTQTVGLAACSIRTSNQGTSVG